jgi:hypothetical protein
MLTLLLFSRASLSAEPFRSAFSQFADSLARLKASVTREFRAFLLSSSANEAAEIAGPPPKDRDENKPAEEEGELPPPDEPKTAGHRKNYKILNVDPNWAFVNTESEIAIVFSPIEKDFKFCKFGDIIVPGNVSVEDGKLRCKSPKHKEGRLKLAIGKDRSAFFGSADFSIIPNRKRWIWILLFGLALVAFLGLQKPRKSKWWIGRSFKALKAKRRAANRRQASNFV